MFFYALYAQLCSFAHLCSHTLVTTSLSALFGMFAHPPDDVCSCALCTAMCAHLCSQTSVNFCTASWWYHFRCYMQMFALVMLYADVRTCDDVTSGAIFTAMFAHLCLHCHVRTPSRWRHDAIWGVHTLCVHDDAMMPYGGYTTEYISL